VEPTPPDEPDRGPTSETPHSEPRTEVASETTPGTQSPDGALPERYRGINWRRSRAVAYRVAYWFTRSPHEAQEVAQEACAAVIDPERRPWDPARHPNFTTYLCRVVKSIALNRATSARDHYEREAGVAYAVAQGDAAPSAEDSLLEYARERRTRERQERLFAALIDELSDDPLARRLALLSRDGIDRPADQARAEQRPIEEIRAARKRVQRAVEKLVAAARGEESDEER
jgi:DNA-directed RNA polymerase specialized sigma24 family protein